MLFRNRIFTVRNTHFATREAANIIRVDLATGASEPVFLAENALGAELPDQLRDIRYLAERNGLLVSGNTGVYYLDLKTGSAVQVPLHTAN